MIPSFPSCMAFSFFFLLPFLTSSASLYSHSIPPNFTASKGAFLLSTNQTFKAAITQSYFSIIHAPSNIVVWSANRETPMSDSGKLSLTIHGLTIITNQSSNNPIWSTPPLTSQVASMQLLETGNLVLVDARNVSLWESFDYPTDTILMGQRLPVGKSLKSGVDDYRFTITEQDAVLQWNGLSYWKLSMDTKAYKDSNMLVSFMGLNGSGLYLFGSDGSTVVFRVVLNSPSDYFRIAKLGYDARFSISSFINKDWVQDFLGPVEDCQIPFICGKLGWCSTSSQSDTGICSCPTGFYSKNPGMNSFCAPTDNSLSLPSSPCNATRNGWELNSSISYLELEKGMDYFAINFMEPAKYGVNLSFCQDLCSQNCSCLGIFHENTSGSCYLLENHLGSIRSSSTTDNNNTLGYIKALVGIGYSPANPNGNNLKQNKKHSFPMVGLVLLPSFGLFLLVITIVVLLKRKRLSKSGSIKLGHRNLSSSEELEIISIPGLPVRFSYEELAAATNNFETRIGSGGFGTVYKGILSDKTVVAVKKISNLGVQGKKEFCTEIAIIGNMHHVNLVRLKGFCAQGSKRFLVLEYMNKGSLDRTLFGNGPVLEWQERFEIAIGTARGLAYLHSQCENKIIHCDIKPENILLHENSQVRISDFGISKLLSPEQSTMFTTMRGTRGYLAPEWLTSTGITDKTDVYSYGMVLLEIVSGRKNFCLSSVLKYFPLLAIEMHEQRRYLELADPRLEGRVTSLEVEKLVRVALCCVQQEPTLRPTMCNVVGMLTGRLSLGEPRMESLNFLRFYGQRVTDASTMERYNEQNVFFWHPQVNATHSSATTGSNNSLSYISSQQVSGPR